MASVDLEAVRDVLVSVALEAGKMMLAANPAELDKDTKLNSVDIVTEADKAVEAMVSSRLTAAYPSFSFVGEESYTPGLTIGPDPTFVVDPIDGTTNFVHGFPAACISLGLAVHRRPAVGVVYSPWQDLLYTAVQGHGAFLTTRGGERKRLPLARSPRPLTGLGEALVAVEWGSTRDGANFAHKVDVFRRLAATRETGGSMVHSLRSLGSAALNIAAVAAGQMDLYWEGGCWAWDVCAGWCILEEAGGRMVHGNAGDWDPELESRVYLAVRGAPSGQEDIVKEFWAVLGDTKLDYTV